MAQPGPSDYRPDYRADPYRQQSEGVMDRVSEFGERAQTLAEDLAGAVKDRPYTTLAVVAGTAFAVGALWMIGRQRPRTRLQALQTYLPELPDVRGRVQDLPSWNDMLRKWWR
jgi:hypothetical protein